MKKTINILLIFVLTTLLFSCLIIPADTSIPGNTDVFSLSDISGDPATTFQSGEDFYMHFCLINTTDDTLDYAMGDSGPIVRFYILKNEIQIASSVDGLDFLAIILHYKFAPGDTIKGWWLAPTPPIDSTLNILDPGTYKAKVFFPEFEELHTDTISDIIFTIVN